jgi:hypothetical protein
MGYFNGRQGLVPAHCVELMETKHSKEIELDSFLPLLEVVTI